VDVDAVANELYALAPSEFTAARDSQAAEARREGDRAAAAAVKALKKPSPPAWAVNLLARERSDDLARLLELGEELRRAQSELRGDELRQLGRQRQSVVAGLAREARKLVAASGHPLSEAAGRQVEETLNAALADPEAARAVVSGRLVRPLEHTGIGPVDIGQAVAAAPLALVRSAGRPEAVPDAGKDGAEQDRRRTESESLRQELESAQAEVQRAETAAAESDAAFQDAERWRANAAGDVGRLETELAEARRQAEAAAARAALAATARDDVGRALDAARRQAVAAAKRLSDLDA
jgi:hypothetical protein